MPKQATLPAFGATTRGRFWHSVAPWLKRLGVVAIAPIIPALFSIFLHELHPSFMTLLAKDMLVWKSCDHFCLHFTCHELRVNPCKSLISRPRCIGGEVARLYRLMVPLEQENEILQVQRCRRCPMGSVNRIPGIKQVGLGLVEWANWICFTELTVAIL